MKKLILRIISKIEEEKKLNEKEIEEVLNNPKYVLVYGFTNQIGSLTTTGKNEMVKEYKKQILEELLTFLFYNTDYFNAV